MITTYIISDAPAENRTRGPTMATLDFTTKPLAQAKSEKEGNFFLRTREQYTRIPGYQDTFNKALTQCGSDSAVEPQLNNQWFTIRVAYTQYNPLNDSRPINLLNLTQYQLI